MLNKDSFLPSTASPAPLKFLNEKCLGPSLLEQRWYSNNVTATLVRALAHQNSLEGKYTSKKQASVQ